MKAIILAAGFSTRLYPLTKNFPKGLLKIQDKEILGYTLDKIVKLPNLSEIVVITNQRYFQHFQSYLQANYAHFQISLLNNGIDDPEIRNGALRDLSRVLDEQAIAEDILVLTSDTLVSLQYDELLRFYDLHQAPVTVAYDGKDLELIRNKLGCLSVDQEQITEFVEKPQQPQSTLMAVPIYIYPRAVLPLIKQYTAEQPQSDAPGSIIPWLLSQTPIYCYQVKGYYYDVGTVEMYNQLASSFTG